MNTLLKNTPQHAERVENNFSLRQDLTDALIPHADSDDIPYIVTDLMPVIESFVNQNYTLNK